jgi:hypothetical protein
MKPLNHLARIGAALAACVLVGTLAVATASAQQTAASALPPNSVYTCDWISAHPAAAAQARVTCDPSLFFGAMSAPAPIAGPTAAILASPDIIESDGCWNIPESGGTVGPGVYAWSSWEYANYWNWSANNGWPNGPIDYTWYIQIPGPTTVNYARVTDLSHGDHSHVIQYPTGNNRRLGFQNHINPAQSWYHCHTQTP